MNKLLLLLLLFLLAGCDDGSATVKFNGYVQRGLDQSEGLSDCKAFYVDGDKVIRCPNSTTMTTTKHSNGKTASTYRTLVIDGVTYAPVQKP